MNRKLKNAELGRLSPEEFKATKKSPIVIVLDNIRSMNNVGSVFRTSDAFKVTHIYLCGHTPRPPHKDIRKTALGATETVDWSYYESTVQLAKKLQDDGFELVAIEQAENTTMLNDFMPQKDKKIALIFGNEVNGVSQELVDLSDVCLEVPQYGTKHSLNISVCAGVVIWDVFNKLVSSY